MLAKMFDVNYYNDYALTCPFGIDRKYMNIDGYKYHEGIDYSHTNYTRMNILNIFSGIITEKRLDKAYGNMIKIKTNPGFAGGVKDEFFTAYCHLAKFNENIKNGFVSYGELLGLMGNTGNSQGIHLHIMCYQKEVREGIKTPLLKDIIDKLKITDDVKNYNWQFVNNGVGILYINPKIIMDYFIKIQV